MNASENRPLRQTSLVLPIVGIVLLLTVIFDFLAQALINHPWDSDKLESLLLFLNEFIDRGVIALIGLALDQPRLWSSHSQLSKRLSCSPLA
jgi:hypothetical protein